MADKKISQLTTLAQADVAVTADFLPIVDTSATETKKATPQSVVLGALGATSANVGIGTASPVGKLQVTGSLGSFILNTSGTEFYNNYAGQVKIYTSNAAGFLSFGSGGRDNDVVLSTTGNLGIGTASPAEKLQVNGSMRLQDTQATISLWKDGTPTKAGQLTFNTARGDAVGLGTFNGTSWSYSLFVDGNGSALAGQPSLATNATNGFLYVPTCAGTPTGTPTAITGMAPIVVDTTNNKMYFYSGGQWRDAGP